MPMDSGPRVHVKGGLLYRGGCSSKLKRVYIAASRTFLNPAGGGWLRVGGIAWVGLLMPWEAKQRARRERPEGGERAALVFNRLPA